VSAPGTTLMSAEMAEQPAVLARLAERFGQLSEQVAGLTTDRVPGVAFLARGSSDHAALLGRYAVELFTGLPTCLVAPSVTTAHAHHPTGFAGWLVVALSQSGRTPEIVSLTREFQAVGARVVGISNDGSSELAHTADLSIDLAAGPERAVPATKTVTAQMLAVLAVAGGLGAPGLTGEQVGQLPDAVARVLADTAGITELGAELAGPNRMAVVGRGFCYPAALETALKLQETSGVMAHGFSTADFRHGPIAVCGPEAPAVLLAGSGPADRDTAALRPELDRRGAASKLIGTEPAARAGWPALGHAGECLLATVRGQQLALARCQALGIDPDQPAGLSKVTLTH
jgi:glutamine---fructose-6-phosphate transaminase (isomerizing)